MALIFDNFQSMDYYPHPKKKPKLDKNHHDWDQLGENDDVWDNAELTVDEFDQLEFEATQRVQVNSVHHDVQPGTSKKNDFENKQYALEGQIKFLSDSLNKTALELSNERMSREQIISDKIKSYQENEQKLKQDIEKAQSSLQFKDHEMKAAHSKVQTLEQRLKECQIPVPNNSSAKNSKEFLNRFQFDKSVVATKEAFVQTFGDHRPVNYSLKLLSPKGECHPPNIMSNFLANKRKTETNGMASSNVCELPFFTYAQLNSRSMSDELWRHYGTLLKKHVSFLQKLFTLSSGKSLQILKKCKFPHVDGSKSLNHSHSTLGDEIELQHSSIISCLKDLRYFFAIRESQECTISSQEQNVQILKWLQELELSSCSAPLFNDEEKVAMSQPLVCLQSLMLLASPDTYPECYSNRNLELQLTLSVLVEWSKRMTMGLSMEPVIFAVPLPSLVSGNHSHKSAHLAIQLLSTLTATKSFSRLFHNNGKCIVASVADLCHNCSNSPKSEFVQIVSSISSFLSGILAVMGSSVLNKDSCSCSTQLAQGFIIMLWRYYKLYSNASYSTYENKVLTNAIQVLHQLSTKIGNFREKRFPVEDQYILLVAALSKLSKGNSAFKNVQDFIHDLWDFQDDVSDEQPDEH